MPPAEPPISDAEAIRAEIHDALMPQLFAAAAAVHAAKTQPGGEALELAGQSLQRAREIARDLISDRPTQPVDSPVVAARRRWETFANAHPGFVVDWPTTCDQDWPAASATVAERIIVESLRNAAVHCGATAASVTIDGQSVAINDRGRGFDVAKAMRRRRGLAAMTRRASAAGLSLKINSGPGGTEVVLQPAAER